jgi:hypothetical protein
MCEKETIGLVLGYSGFGWIWRLVPVSFDLVGTSERTFPVGGRHVTLWSDNYYVFGLVGFDDSDAQYGVIIVTPMSGL